MTRCPFREDVALGHVALGGGLGEQQTFALPDFHASPPLFERRRGGNSILPAVPCVVEHGFFDDVANFVEGGESGLRRRFFDPPRNELADSVRIERWRGQHHHGEQLRVARFAFAVRHVVLKVSVEWRGALKKSCMLNGRACCDDEKVHG